MFKSKQEIIVIQAEAADPITTGVVFWSHDKGTAKLLFQLKKDTVNQTLAEGTIVPILLEFNTVEGRGKHIYHAVIEDALNGIVSIVLEDNILGYQGRVDGSIYIELPDSRSLDTAGRFTFDIKRSPIDENVAELEDYYWQGFNEIMTQYHQTIATIKLEAKELLDSLTADVTTAQNKVTALEKSITTATTNLNARVDEINKKLDDNDVFTKTESSANVVDQIVGKESLNSTFSIDFAGKISGSLAENGNRADWGNLQTLQAPSSVSLEFVQYRYNNIKMLDSLLNTTQTSESGKFSVQCLKYNLIDIYSNRYGEKFWSSQGAQSDAQKAEILRKIIVKLESKNWGYGSGPGGNKLYMANWASGSWVNTQSHNLEIVSGLTISTSYVVNKIDDKGFYYVILYAEASDGHTASTVNTDYGRLDITENISANEFIHSTIAANHVENLATQEEAETGTDNTKTMTPLRTAQQIENKAVTIAGNQTVGGIKNFRDGLMIDDAPIGTANDACWCEDFTVNNLAAGIINPDIQRFETTNQEAFSASGKTITIKKPGVYLITLGVNYTGLPGWVTFGISRTDGTSLVKRSLLESSTAGSNSLTYVRNFSGDDQLRIEFNSEKSGITMGKINLAFVKLA